jgi:hypothetical protein
MLQSVHGIEAESISISNGSNFHKVTLDMQGGVTDGGLIIFEDVKYTQHNPLWNTDIKVKGYIREIKK